MHIIGISVLRFDGSLPEPIFLSTATDLSKFGFFERSTYVTDSNSHSFKVVAVLKLKWNLA